MVLEPSNQQELCETLRRANEGGDRVTDIRLDRLNRLVDHTPEDMTAKVEAGITLAELQSQLARQGQWLPIDPPHPERTTIGAILAGNKSGPRRLGFGTIREHLIGITVALADGRLIHAGGRVVKNVAGYDLMKLFVGSQGSLGVIVDGTFKLRPISEREEWVQATWENRQDALGVIDRILLDSELTPIALDLHNLQSPSQEAEPAAAPCKPSGHWTVVAGFAGSQEEVAWQLEQARALGISTSACLDYASRLWDDPGQPGPSSFSVLPSKLPEALDALGSVPVIARAGNGMVYHLGGTPPQETATIPVNLFKRIKQAYDPHAIFPEWHL